MDDIDIERLREAVEDWERVSLTPPSGASLVEMATAARWLLDLADEGGELWRFGPAPSSAQPCECDFCGDMHAAPGGSRVRVWPKEDDHG